MTNLIQRVEEVQRLARRVVWCHAAGWFLATLVSGFVLLALSDYIVRPVEPVARWLFSAAWLACAVGGMYRWLRNAWHFQPTLLETAQHIEQRFPALQGQLAGSVEFLQQSEQDPAAGSLALRRRVIAATEVAITQLNLATAVNSRPQQQGLLLASVLLVGLVLWSLLSFSTFQVAVTRLTLPWSNATWPRQHHLEFVAPPSRIARGQTWEATVRDASGQTPESVTLTIRYAQGETVRHAMKFLNGQMVHRLENITQPFEYRASGGDDDTLPWQTLEVVEPLRIVELKTHVVPPKYAGPAWEATGNVFTMLAGSQVEVSGRVDRPLTAASIRHEKSANTTPLAVAADGLSFTATPQLWKPLEAGVYGLSLCDAHGVTSPAAYRWEVRIAPDHPPTLTLDSPREAMPVTPQALLPIAGTAKDDLAVERVTLKYLPPTATDAPPSELVCWQATENPVAGTKRSSSTGSDVKAFSAQWDLQLIAGLKPGDVLSWYVESRDFSPQAGQTTLTKLQLISPAELQERLAQRQISALAQLAEALKVQRETRSKIGSLEVQWREIPTWRPRDRDTLQNAELHQRQTQSLTGNAPTGAATILTSILSELEINRLELPDMQAKCSELLASLTQLDRQAYPAVGQHFSELLRETKTAGEVSAGTKQHLNALAQEQEGIIQLLETVLGNLNEWDSFQRMRRDLTQLRKTQQELTASTQQLQAEMLTSGKATPEQTTQAKQLARQQSELARQFEKWQMRLAQYVERATNETARTARSTLETAQQAAVAGKMRTAAQALGESKLGSSLERQQEIETAFAKLLDELAGRKTEDATAQLQQLRETLQRVEQLRQQQQQLAEEFAKQAQQPQPELQRLEERQTALAQQTDKLQQQLEQKEPNSPAGQATKSAGESMQQAAGAAQKQQAKTAEEQARAAEQKLAEAKQAVQQEIANREADLLRERLAKLEQHIQGLLLREESLEKECQRLQASVAPSGELTPVQLATCSELRREQEALAAETSEQGRSPNLPAAFSWQLEQTAREMQVAAEQLAVPQLAATLLLQQAAIARLKLIIQALQQDAPNTPPNEQPPGEQPPPKPPQDGNPPDIHDLAEVKLLRAMQAEINRRTLEIDAQRSPAGALPPELNAQLEQLAVEQGKLVNLTLKLVQKLSQPAAETPAPKVSDEDLLKQLDDALLPAEKTLPKQPEK